MLNFRRGCYNVQLYLMEILISNGYSIDAELPNWFWKSLSLLGSIGDGEVRV